MQTVVTPPCALENKSVLQEDMTPRSTPGQVMVATSDVSSHAPHCERRKRSHRLGGIIVGVLGMSLGLLVLLAMTAP